MPLPAASPGQPSARVSQQGWCWPHQGFPWLLPPLVWAGAARSIGPPSPCRQPQTQPLLHSLPPSIGLVPGRRASHSETEESALNEGEPRHPGILQDFGGQLVVPVPRQGYELGYLNAGSFLLCPKWAAGKTHCHGGDGGGGKDPCTLLKDTQGPLPEPNSRGLLAGPKLAQTRA